MKLLCFLTYFNVGFLTTFFIICFEIALKQFAFRYFSLLKALSSSSEGFTYNIRNVFIWFTRILLSYTLYESIRMCSSYKGYSSLFFQWTIVIDDFFVAVSYIYENHNISFEVSDLYVIFFFTSLGTRSGSWKQEALGLSQFSIDWL